MMSKTIIYIFKKCKGGGGGETQSIMMVVVLTTKEMSYLVVELFDDLVRPLCIYIHDIKFFGCTVCFNSGIATKGSHLPPKLYALFYWAYIELFSSKNFPLNPVLQILF